MKAFNVPTREEVSPASQWVFDKLKETIGFVPNLYATMAYSENGLPRYLAFQNGKTSLNSKEKEAVNLVVSQVNNCRYCLSAHTVIARMNGFSDEEILKIRNGQASDDKMAALVALTKSITVNNGRIPLEMLEGFFIAGYDEGNLVDVILQVSDNIASNYLHNLTDIPVDFPCAPDLD